MVLKAFLEYFRGGTGKLTTTCMEQSPSGEADCISASGNKIGSVHIT